MKTKRILVCDGTVDGIFTAIYKAYEMKYGHDFIKIVENDTSDSYMDMELFSEYIDVDTDYTLSEKVGRTIRLKISNEAYQYVVRAALSEASGRADVIYRFVILGLHMGPSVMEHLSDPNVYQVFKYNRNVGSETHNMLGFLRFTEVGEGILLAVMKPKNHILTLIAPHFADRLNNEDFIIYDEGRKVAAIHKKNTEPIIMNMDDDFIEALNDKKSKQEDYENLWKAFYKSIAIKERENLVLQRNNLPLRFRGNMTEFQKTDGKEKS